MHLQSQEAVSGKNERCEVASCNLLSKFIQYAISVVSQRFSEERELLRLKF
jgi:hypothetical protein